MNDKVVRGCSIPDSVAHIADVQTFMQKCISDLVARACNHDRVKLLSPEMEGFDAVHASHVLSNTEYMSPEYIKGKEMLGQALKHHYDHCDHHPEHFGGGIQSMNFLQLIELVCDWSAAVRRHKNGNILRSIEQNQARFGYSDETKKFMINTALFINDVTTGG